MRDAPGMQLLRMLRHILIFLLYAAIGAVLAGVVVFVWLGVNGKPDLKPWHTATLRAEFRAADSGRVNTIEAYRKLEDRLFEELKSEVYQRTDASDRRVLNRYSAGSRADPMALPENFNRTFELATDAPRAGVILIHGLTDSPYVFRALASKLHERGCWVVVLRLPGHGTAPSALATIDWRDWAAAVRMATADLRRRLPAEVPLYMVGFSTGAALAVEYSLARLEGEELPGADALVLLSPAIGVDPLAWLAVWQERLSMLPGLGKLAWLDLIPEYDPYKYNSFPVRAGREIYTLTQVIDERITRLSAHGAVQGFPRTLAFQSIADATVSPQAVVRIFLDRLAAEGHELVAFDVNRRADAQPFLGPRCAIRRAAITDRSNLPFGVTLITNEGATSSGLVALHRPCGADGRRWHTHRPQRGQLACSLSRIQHCRSHRTIRSMVRSGHPRPAASILDESELLGEQGLLAIPANALVRLRFNPFFSYEETRIEQFLALGSDTH